MKGEVPKKTKGVPKKALKVPKKVKREYPKNNSRTNNRRNSETSFHNKRTACCIDRYYS